MKRDTVVALVLALLALLAIGVAAATLDNPATSGGDGGIGSGDGSGVGSGDGESQPTMTEREEESSPGVPGMEQGTISGAGACVQWLDKPLTELGLVLGVLLIVGAIVYRTREPALAVLGLPIATMVYMVYLVLTACGEFELNIGGAIGLGTGDSGGNNSTGGSMGEAADVAANQPSLVLGLLLVVLIVGAVILLVFATGDSGEAADEPPEPDPEPEQPDIGAVGRAAGAAADRIAEEADASNEVYRAWAEMTEYLAVEGPESSTPAEFAAAAVDAGMAPDDVRELTELFEAVRYGTDDATEEREERALAALRRIETAYAEAEE